MKNNAYRWVIKKGQGPSPRNSLLSWEEKCCRETKPTESIHFHLPLLLQPLFWRISDSEVVESPLRKFFKKISILGPLGVAPEPQFPLQGPSSGCSSLRLLYRHLCWSLSGQTGLTVPLAFVASFIGLRGAQADGHVPPWVFAAWAPHLQGQTPCPLQA